MLKNPSSQASWQLNKPLSIMSPQERLEAMGYIEALLQGGYHNPLYLHRLAAIRSKISRMPRTKVDATQDRMFPEINLKKSKKGK